MKRIKFEDVKSIRKSLVNETAIIVDFKDGDRLVMECGSSVNEEFEALTRGFEELKRSKARIKLADMFDYSHVEYFKPNYSACNIAVQWTNGKKDYLHGINEEDTMKLAQLLNWRLQQYKESQAETSPCEQ